MQQEPGLASVAECPALTLPAGPRALLEGSPLPPRASYLPTQPQEGPLTLGHREAGLALAVPLCPHRDVPPFYLVQSLGVSVQGSGSSVKALGEFWARPPQLQL